MSLTTTSLTLTQLVNFLTRPLIFTHSATSITRLQLALQANFSSFVPLSNNGEIISPFTLYFSPSSLPITPVYAACLSARVSWDTWIAALSGGKDIYVFVTQGCIKVGYPGKQETVNVWTEDAEPQLVSSRVRPETPLPMVKKLQAVLESARSRRENQIQESISDNSSPITISVIPATPVSTSTPPQASEPDSETLSDSDSDSDTDSDTESTTSSTFSSRSLESMTSVSSISSVTSAASSGCSNAFGKPFPVLSRAHEWVSAPTSQRRSKTINRSKNDVMKYMYQGGQTGVMTGGVMLGGVSTGNAKTSSLNFKRKTAGSGSGDWRRRV